MGKPCLHIAGQYQALLSGVGFSPQRVFEDGAIKPWRKLPDRENCTWEIAAAGSGTVRLHVKRYGARIAAAEAAGYRALHEAGIATASVVAWGALADGRGFLITEDLAGRQPADKLIVSQSSFEPMLQGSAELVGQLHGAGLHHRDLYLCHFFARASSPADLCLIDAARVRRLPLIFRRRWLVKDLAQFWYSTLSLPISEGQRIRWLEHYAKRRGIVNVARLANSVQRKSAWIAAHDRNLRRKQPGRNVSIPSQEGKSPQ